MLLNAVPAHPRPRVRVAGAKFPAFVAARTRAAHGALRVPEDAAAFLAPHAIHLLPVSAEIRTELHRSGLHTMGAVASISAPALADRFGTEGSRAWELCSGIDDARVVPLAELEQANLLPPFLRQLARDLSPSQEYIAHAEPGFLDTAGHDLHP